MEAIIGLTPLHIFVKKIAATSALKLQRKLHNQHMVLSLTGHLEILRELGRRLKVPNVNFMMNK